MSDDSFRFVDALVPVAPKTEEVIPVARVKGDPLGAWRRFEPWGIIAAGSLQLIVLLGVLTQPLMIHLTGKTYYVRVQPVDPRDLFRGEYVILSYDFSRIDHARFAEVKNDPLIVEKLVPGRTIYVSLVPEGDGKHHRADKFSFRPFREGPYLAGTIQHFNSNAVFGIESFFVQEGKGRAFEEALRSRRLSAEILVTASGASAVRQLHIGDVPR